MNPFLEILDSLLESFSAILGRPRGVKPTRAEEIERPAESPLEAAQTAPIEGENLDEEQLPADQTSEDSEETPPEAPETPETSAPEDTEEELDPDRPGDMPPSETEVPAAEEQPQVEVEPEPESEPAAEAPEESLSPIPVVPPTLPEPVERKVMVIHFDPFVPSAKGRRLSDALAGRDPEDLLSVFISDLRECSAGYARYRVVERVNIDRLPVKCDGFQYSPDHYLQCWQTGSGFHSPDTVDYEKIFAEAGIAEKVNTGIVDEVWMFGPPYCGFYESVMAGKGAFYLNAPALNLSVKMDRRIVIMGFNYERGEGEMLESYGHRTEDILRKVFEDTRGQSNLWERFTRHERSAPGKAEVGTIHYAPNSERDYDWGNPREVTSRCDAWLAFPDLTGQGRLVKGEDWGDGDMRAHHKWWFTRLPHVAGLNAGIDCNWWKYIVDPNEVK
jgi:hypothetical protein